MPSYHLRHPRARRSSSDRKHASSGLFSSAGNAAFSVPGTSATGFSADRFSSVAGFSVTSSSAGRLSPAAGLSGFSPPTAAISSATVAAGAVPRSDKEPKAAARFAAEASNLGFSANSGISGSASAMPDCGIAAVNASKSDNVSSAASNLGISGSIPASSTAASFAGIAGSAADVCAGLDFPPPLEASYLLSAVSRSSMLKSLKSIKSSSSSALPFPPAAGASFPSAASKASILPTPPSASLRFNSKSSFSLPAIVLILESQNFYLNTAYTT